MLCFCLSSHSILPQTPCSGCNDDDDPYFTDEETECRKVAQGHTASQSGRKWNPMGLLTLSWPRLPSSRGAQKYWLHSCPHNGVLMTAQSRPDPSFVQPWGHVGCWASLSLTPAGVYPGKPGNRFSCWDSISSGLSPFLSPPAAHSRN